MDPTTTLPPQPVAPNPAIAPLAPVAKGDKHIWGIYIMLCFISIIELYSASSQEVSEAGMDVYGTIVRHIMFLLIGFGIIYTLQRIHYRKIIRWIVPFAILSVSLMIYTSHFGTMVNGARRSLHIVFFSVYPSEMLKLSAASIVSLVMVHSQLRDRNGVSNRGVVVAAGVILIYCALLAPQGLTNTLLLMCISFSMMVVGGIGVRKLITVLLVYGACFGCYLLYTHLRTSADDTQTELASGTDTQESVNRTGEWQRRINNFFGTGQPKYTQSITSDNRQEMLGYIAQAHGGVLGVGPGNSRETSRLPLAYTDYIYSIIVEELGLIGGIVILILYLWLLARASAIASNCVRALPAQLVIGMALTIVFQALFHICIVTGVIPVSGQPLPLISKGGTSIIITSIAFGIMLSVSRFAARKSTQRKEIKREEEALPEQFRAANPSQL